MVVCLLGTGTGCGARQISEGGSSSDFAPEAEAEAEIKDVIVGR